MLTYILNGLVFEYNGVRTVFVYTERHLTNCIANGTQPWAMTFLTVAPNSDPTIVVNAIHDWVNKANDNDMLNEQVDNAYNTNNSHGVEFTSEEKREIVELNDFPYHYIKRS